MDDEKSDFEFLEHMVKSHSLDIYASTGRWMDKQRNGWTVAEVTQHTPTQTSPVVLLCHGYM